MNNIRYLDYFETIQKTIDKLTSKKYFTIKLSVFLCLISFFLSFPDLLSFNPNSEGWKAIYLKANNLVDPLTNFAPETWIAKKVFRLSLPLFIHFTGASPYLIYIIQVLCGMLIFIYAYKLIFKISNDNTISLLLTASVSFTYFGRACFYDFAPWFDGFAYLFILCAMYNSNLILIFLFSTLAAWIDERGFIALPIIYFYHQLQPQLNNENKSQFKSLLVPNKMGITVILSMLMYLSLRYLLGYLYNMKTPSEDLNYHLFIENTHYISLALWNFLEGFWVFILLGFFTFIINKQYFNFSILFIYIICQLLVTFFVADLTRSGTYILPLSIVFFKYLYDKQVILFYRQLSFVSLLLCLFTAPTFICTDWPAQYWYKDSLPVYVFKKIIH
jgi:hypothetical protein